MLPSLPSSSCIMSALTYIHPHHCCSWLEHLQPFWELNEGAQFRKPYTCWIQQNANSLLESLYFTLGATVIFTTRPQSPLYSVHQINQRERNCWKEMPEFNWCFSTPNNCPPACLHTCRLMITVPTPHSLHKFPRSDLTQDDVILEKSSDPPTLQVWLHMGLTWALLCRVMSVSEGDWFHVPHQSWGNLQCFSPKKLSSRQPVMFGVVEKGFGDVLNWRSSSTGNLVFSKLTFQIGKVCIVSLCVHGETKSIIVVSDDWML